MVRFPRHTGFPRYAAPGSGLTRHIRASFPCKTKFRREGSFMKGVLRTCPRHGAYGLAWKKAEPLRQLVLVIRVRCTRSCAKFSTLSVAFFLSYFIWTATQNVPSPSLFSSRRSTIRLNG